MFIYIMMLKNGKIHKLKKIIKEINLTIKSKPNADPTYYDEKLMQNLKKMECNCQRSCAHMGPTLYVDVKL